MPMWAHLPRALRRRRLTILAAALAGPGLAWSRPSFAADGTWTLNANGTWSNPANWLGGAIPGAPGDAANFGTNITAARTVTLDAPFTVGSLNFNSTNSYTLTGGGSNAL